MVGSRALLQVLSTAAVLAVLTATSVSAQSVTPDNMLTAEEKKAGWILLFDGKSVNDWLRLTDQLPCPDAVDSGAINPHKCPESVLLIHKQQWANFRLKVDFKVSPGGNSGIFLRTLPGTDVGPEVQILDSREADYHDVGAIYDLVKPTKNALKPAGEWNHYEITVDQNLIDVWLNGEKVNHMDLNEWTEPNKRPDGTDHKFDVAWKDHPRNGYIGLQDHGDPVWFRSIKILPLK